MDLRGRVTRWGLARPRVLLVDAPGDDTLRWEVEDELDRRGWRMALSPADTDLLLTLGAAGPQLSGATDVLWSQIPRPRHRATLTAARMHEQLNAVAVALLDVPPDAPGDEHPATLLAGDPPGGAPGDPHSSHGIGHGGDHMEHGGNVAGLAMADRAPDRDGLQLDALKVTLGPVLPGWPTGLAMHATLQGDVLTEVGLRWLDPADPDVDRHPVADPAPWALDRLSRFLLVAGWPDAARQARQARAALTGPNPSTRARGGQEAVALARKVRRSRALAWSVQGMPGDVWDRVRSWCDVATGGDFERARAADLRELATLLDGAELAAARLVVASHD